MVFIFSLLAIIMTGNYWLIILTFLCFIPFMRMQGIEFDKNGKKINHVEYFWFKKKIVEETTIPLNIKNILLTEYFSTVRSYTHGGGVFNLDYKYSNEYKVNFYLNDKSVVEIKHPKVFVYEKALRITNFIAKHLNLTVYERSASGSDVESFDLEYYEQTGKEASHGFKILGNQVNEK